MKKKSRNKPRPSLSQPSSKHYSIKATVYDKRGRILSIGYNSYIKTHPRMYELANQVNQPYKIFLHAEIAALVKIRSGIPYKILIERYSKDGSPKLAAPCLVCMEAIAQAGIQRIEYTIG